MAQRYGGKYSPGGSTGPAPRADDPAILAGVTRSKIGARVNLLFAAPLPILAMAFFKPPVMMAVALGAVGVLLLAAWLLREGLKAEEAYDARTIARRPAVPRKILASLATGIGLGLAGVSHEAGLVAPVLFAVLGAALHLAAFGPDPLKDKGLEGVDTFQTNRVASAVEAAEEHLAAMSDAILRAKDREAERALEAFQARARAMFRKVEADPRDLTAARKYLSVYLLGARDATIKFADFYARTRDAQARADYLALLSDLGDEFAARTEKLLLDDRSDLDIEIGVLRDRLAREGVTART